MSNKFFKEVNYYFKNVQYSTDRGLLMEDVSTEHYLQLDYEKELYDFRSSTTGVIINCVFRMSNQKDIYTRKYIKIQDVLAQVGGLVKAIIVVVQILYSNFSKVGYYFHLWENMFEVKNLDLDFNSNIGPNNLYVFKNNINNSSISLPMTKLNKNQKYPNHWQKRNSIKNKQLFLNASNLVYVFALFPTVKIKRNPLIN